MHSKNIHFWSKQRKIQYLKKNPKKKVSLELLHQILGHISTRSLLDLYNEIFWKGIEIRVYPEPLCTSCQIFIINEKDISKIPLNPKTYFKWVFMDTISAICSKSLTKDTTFDKYLLFVDAYSKFSKICGM